MTDDGEAKTRTFASRAELLSKLGRKEALWHRTALDAQERREDFDRAGQAILAGADSVTVGRTTYVIVDTEATDERSEGR
jgi:hypothetical protein